MANILNQVVVQENVEGIEKRMIVQYKDDITEESSQVIVDYDSLTAEEKAIYDAFIALSNSKI
jgi:uncharacterized lipoprotein YehR (DUF1307 family)